MSLRQSLQVPVEPDDRRRLRSAQALVWRAGVVLACGGLFSAPAPAGSSRHANGTAKTPHLSAPVPRVVIYQANRQPNGLKRYSGPAAIARDTSAPMQSRPILHPLRPGTFSALTVHNPNATVNFQVLAVGGQRTIVPNGLAPAPKSFAFKPGDLPVGKFPRLDWGGGGPVLQNPFNQINFHAPQPAPIQTRFFFPSALGISPEPASALFAGGGVQPMSEFDDLYQFLWFSAFLAAVGSVIYGGIRAANRAMA